MRQKFALLWSLILCMLAAQSHAADKNDSIRVLWIGNSYTYVNDLPAIVKSIAATKKWNISNTRILKGGEQFSGHLKNARLTELLKKEKWDYVIMQEQSSNPSLSSETVAQKTYAPAKEIIEKVRQNSPNAHIIFYQTWGHKYGNSQKEDKPYPLNDTYEGMQDRLNMSYLEMAWANKAWCAPVGMAWKQIRKDHPEYILYSTDGSHPSILGSYLAANVIFCTMLQKPFQTAFHPEKISEEQAEIIQQTAQETVMNNLKLIGIEK